MANPLEKIKKLKNRGWEEFRTRGAQAISARSEQIGLSGKLPSDEEFYRLFDGAHFAEQAVTPENILAEFRRASGATFFPSFRDQAQTIETFRRIFGRRSAPLILAKAEKIVQGKFDLLGFTALDFGADVDWHLEPISGKRAPLKHWKAFDELDAAETGDKKIVWELNRHQHFFTLGVAYWLTKNERFADCFVRQMESWMRQNPPATGVNWVSSLEIAFRLMSWIWAFNFFKDSPHLTAEFFSRALKLLYLQSRHIEKYLSTYYSPNTHLTGEALGLYYLGTQLPFLSRAKIWRETGEKILLGELDRQILPDGVYFEQSTWYQRYTADFYQHFLILKRVEIEKDDDAQTREKLRAKTQSALDFLMRVTRPDGTTPLVGDDDGGRILPLSFNTEPDDFRGTLALAAALFGRGDYKFVAETVSPEIVWLLGAGGVKSFENTLARKPEKSSAAFDSGGYFVMRDGWAKTDNYLLVDCGEIGALSGGHGHADTLSVNAALHGKTLLTDSGTYSYHESAETRDYYRSTAAHNALTIDGKSSSVTANKFSWKTRAEAQIENWISQERFDFFSGSHNGFQKQTEIAATHRRSILFLKNDYWIMRDFVETTGAHDYALDFHCAENTNPSIENARGGGLCVGESFAENDCGWRVFTFGDNGGWQKKESWISNVYGAKTAAPLLRFVSQSTGAQEFYTFMLPSEKGFAAPEVYETTVSGGRAFAVNYRDYWDLLVCADPGEQTVRTEFFNTNFRFFWSRMSADEKTPEEFVMIGGTYFSLGEREVINQNHELTHAAARRFGSKLNVHTAENVFSVSIPQKTSKTYILKTPE